MAASLTLDSQLSSHCSIIEVRHIGRISIKPSGSSLSWKQVKRNIKSAALHTERTKGKTTTYPCKKKKKRVSDRTKELFHFVWPSKVGRSQTKLCHSWNYSSVTSQRPCSAKLHARYRSALKYCHHKSHRAGGDCPPQICSPDSWGVFFPQIEIKGTVFM